MPIDFEFALVCDDARREDNGKLFLIGVYGTNMLVPSFPAALVVALAMGVSATESTELQTDLRVLLDEKEILSGSGQMRAQLPGRQIFPVKNLLIQVESAGTLHFQIRPKEGEWQTLCSMPITLQPKTDAST